MKGDREPEDVHSRLDELLRRLAASSSRSLGGALGYDEREELLHIIATRRLDRTHFPAVFLEATVVELPEAGETAAGTRVTATGCTPEGDPEPLGVTFFESIDQRHWITFLLELRARGLSGVQQVLAEPTEGLQEAIEVAFPQSRFQAVPPNFSPDWLALPDVGEEVGRRSAGHERLGK